MTPQTTSQSLHDGADTALHLGNELINSAGHAIDQTRELASKSLDAAAEATARAQKQLRRYADATSHYVADQPLRSVLVAAAVGALVAALVMATRRGNSR